ncbi:hypothetical protein KC345_g157 [Hortaea werneckii]|nr:hypothetical protein KC345_g157 [Hortaea werneckii]
MIHTTYHQEWSGFTHPSQDNSCLLSPVPALQKRAETAGAALHRPAEEVMGVRIIAVDGTRDVGERDAGRRVSRLASPFFYSKSAVGPMASSLLAHNPRRFSVIRDVGTGYSDRTLPALFGGLAWLGRETILRCVLRVCCLGHVAVLVATRFDGYSSIPILTQERRSVHNLPAYRPTDDNPPTNYLAAFQSPNGKEISTAVSDKAASHLAVVFKKAVHREKNEKEMIDRHAGTPTPSMNTCRSITEFPTPPIAKQIRNERSFYGCRCPYLAQATVVISSARRNGLTPNRLEWESLVETRAADELLIRGSERRPAKRPTPYITLTRATEREGGSGEKEMKRGNTQYDEPNHRLRSDYYGRYRGRL